jgi:F0F1-type ATP synthase delta subunit
MYSSKLEHLKSFLNSIVLDEDLKKFFMEYFSSEDEKKRKILKATFRKKLDSLSETERNTFEETEIQILQNMIAHLGNRLNDVRQTAHVA